MNIINGKNDIEKFKIFLNKIKNYNNIFDIDFLINLNNYEDFLLIEKNGIIIDFINVYTEDNITYLAPNFTNYSVQLEELHLLKYAYPNYVLECNESFLNPEQKEYFKCKYDSRINKNYNYNINNGYNYYVSTERKVHLIRDNFENQYFEPLNLNNITFINISCSDINKILYEDSIFGIPTWTDGENYSIAGFHYFTNTDNDKYGKYLLCMDNNNILGVIKHGVYEEYGTIHQCICYVDVNFAYRKNGISKILANQMNAHLIDGLPLVITDESEMGKKCHMHQIFKNCIDKKIYTYQELQDMEYQEQIEDLRKY